MDADVFKAWVTQELLPKIPKISIIVMDNAAFPKRQDIQDSLTSAAHTLDPISIPLSMLGLCANVFDAPDFLLMSNTKRTYEQHKQ